VAATWPGLVKTSPKCSARDTWPTKEADPPKSGIDQQAGQRQRLKALEHHWRHPDQGCPLAADSPRLVQMD